MLPSLGEDDYKHIHHLIIGKRQPFNQYLKVYLEQARGIEQIRPYWIYRGQIGKVI